MTETLPLIARAQEHADRVALRGDRFETTYDELLRRSHNIAAALLDAKKDLDESRVAFFVPAGSDYVSTQWAIWRAGGVAVPLCLSAADPELEYTLTDSAPRWIVTTPKYVDRLEAVCQKLGLPLLVVDEVSESPDVALPTVQSDRRAMILYTSGTTNKPKGVVTTHDNIASQIVALIQAWEWQESDSIPLFLPLHHIHGIINVMSCALWAGATIEPFVRFDLEAILSQVAGNRYTLFMAVPTIYVKLIQALETLEALDSERRQAIVAGFSSMRLMVSGSAALPASVHEKWTELTGQKLLERYGMTEIGMALSNPFRGERRPGAVGQPLPLVEIRLKSDQDELVGQEDEPGEIQVRGPAVFLEYWNREAATRESFDDVWFRTGDMAVLETGYYRIMGRLSVDIIKSGGYKLSALEIEAVLLLHAAILECAVVGIQDDTWGEIVAVAAVLTTEHELDLEQLQSWSAKHLAKYKIPRRLLIVDDLPRNAMGKVTKRDVGKMF
jgi:malonyl-CoA/methylmalonyl-CoA synthetase